MWQKPISETEVQHQREGNSRTDRTGLIGDEQGTAEVLPFQDRMVCSVQTVPERLQSQNWVATDEVSQQPGPKGEPVLSHSNSGMIGLRDKNGPDFHQVTSGLL